MKPQPQALFFLFAATLGCAAPSNSRPTPSAGAAGGMPSDVTDHPPADHDGGFLLRSQDGSSELAIEGLFQVVASVLDGDRDPGTDIALKRMRPELSGRIANSMRFKLEPKFTEDEVELEEAWVGFEVAGGKALVMVGRMKSPFNLEEVRSRRNIDFPRFSILNQLAPAEDHGIFVNGKSETGRWEYGLAGYNGTGTSDTGSSKDLAGRLMLHPFASQSSGNLRNLQLGLAVTVGSQELDVGGESIENALGLPIVTFAPGVALDGTRWRAGLEGAWFNGPWFAQAEAIAMSQEMSLGASSEHVSMRGAYFTLSRALTGEDKDFGGVSPRDPHEFSTGSGSGAWVLATRVSQLDIDDDVAVSGLSAPGTFTDRIRTLSLGLNWIPNDNLILRNALIYSSYDNDVAIGSGRGDSEFGLLIELQLHF